MNRPSLTEPGVRYFIGETLKNCSKHKFEYNNTLLNTVLFTYVCTYNVLHTVLYTILHTVYLLYCIVCEKGFYTVPSKQYA